MPGRARASEGERHAPLVTNAAGGCPGGPTADSDGDGIDDTFVQMTVGTNACFEVIPQRNTVVPATTDPQFYRAFVDVVGVRGHVPLDRRAVLFLVPPKDVGVK